MAFICLLRLLATSDEYVQQLQLKVLAGLGIKSLSGLLLGSLGRFASLGMPSFNVVALGILELLAALSQ